MLYMALKHYAHRCGALRTTVEADGGTEKAGEAAHHCQTKAEALDLLMTGGDGAVELVEDFPAFLCGYAAAGVGEDNECVAVLTTCRETYLAALVAVFRGIGDEVAHDDAQCVAVGVQYDVVGCDVHLYVYAAPDDLILDEGVDAGFVLYDKYLCHGLFTIDVVDDDVEDIVGIDLADGLKELVVEGVVVVDGIVGHHVEGYGALLLKIEVGMDLLDVGIALQEGHYTPLQLALPAVVADGVDAYSYDDMVFVVE